ncbi:SIR2 family protein [Bradyrhizobium pachyrhizi]|uniref:P-loop NTPase n=1 Tax=Bradyrhizobium pachyrhizi TaxID=280333 RepID=UPI0024B1C11E|nr:SIR2 family protein [Bradyrhizobium pachyrhizi]WFU56819.1 SIR2 family protein [Bradyrhizobium pachyrhizi]
MGKKPAAPLVKIPDVLVEAVKSKRVIPFLGAGASKESRNSTGKMPPDADQLRDILALKFFGKLIPNRDVMAVSDMAISSAGGTGLVYDAVQKAFDGFPPSQAHIALSAFNWRTIATTNYDTLVEQAYSSSSKRLQSLVRFVKDDEPVEERMQAVTNPVAYLKLHGCLDHIYDKDVPLVLAKEQYATYSANRTHLFERLKQLARESTLLFIGYRLDDPHIRELIYKLEINRRPRWYIVTPDAEDYDINYWSSKNVEVIKAKFAEFMQSLDAAVPPLWRSLSVSDAVSELPLRKFYVQRVEESDKVKLALQNDLTHVHAGMASAPQTAERFYSGYDSGWGSIVQRLDARRKIEDELLFTILLENENVKGPLLVVTRGPGGAGKSIVLKRTAFEAATASSALVLWLNEDGALRPEVFLEIHELTNATIYLFVDQLALHVDKLLGLYKIAKQRQIPLVIVGAERDADWNTYCGALEDLEPVEKRVGNLSGDETSLLLDLLEKHSCLGLLKEKNHEERVEAFMGRAARQLLVALHELTQGKPFEEIVFSEHQNVNPEQARQLYLDIATMHQFGVNIRAGTISRISGIDFEEYKNNFFHPLENIVRVTTDSYSGDYVYRTRHARVAQLVFKQVCPTDEAKARQFIRILDGIDVGYSSDRRALEEMTKGRGLVENFNKPDEVRGIYEAAINAAPTQAFLHQQWAVFELNHPQGSIADAERHAAVAHELDPKNKSIVHTQAEIDRRRASDEPSGILKESLRRRVRARLAELPHNDRFTVSSRCKLLVDEVEDIGRALAEDAKPHDAIFFAEKVKDAETALLKAQQEFPDDADIIQVEARLRSELDQKDKALWALERAWAAGPRGSGLAIRVARIYQARKREVDAEKILKEALTRNADDKQAHQMLALHYLRQPNFDADLVEQHLRNSFSAGDANYEERYVLCEFLFYRGQPQRVSELFDYINAKAPPSFRRVAPRKESAITSLLGRYSGTVDGMKPQFFFIRSGSYPSNVFAHNSLVDPEVLSELSVGSDVNFRIRFNRSGPCAIDLKLGRSTK